MSESAKLAPEQKAAAVIVALGADKASQIYKYLGEEDVEKLTVEVPSLAGSTVRNQSRCWMNFIRPALPRNL